MFGFFLLRVSAKNTALWKPLNLSKCADNKKKEKIITETRRTNIIRLGIEEEEEKRKDKKID